MMTAPPARPRDTNSFMQHALSTYLFKEHRLTTVWLDRIWDAGIPLVELFVAKQHLDYCNKAQIVELGHWFRDAELQVNSLHSPLYRDDVNGRSGPQSVISITEREKAKRIAAVDDIKRTLEMAEYVPTRYLIQHLGVPEEEFSEYSVDAAFSALEELTLFAQQKPVTVDTKVLRAAGTAADALPGSWVAYGKTQGETRYSPLKQIDTTNVSRLGLAWTYEVGAGGSNQEGTPLMWNNTLYGITTWSVVYALDARTGERIWRWDPEINQPAVRPKICCGIVNRGIALYNGMIIAPLNDGRMVALNALTGKPVWETRVAYPQELFTLTMAPRIAGDKVIIGASGGDRPTRGFFAASLAPTPSWPGCGRSWIR